MTRTDTARRVKHANAQPMGQFKRIELNGVMWIAVRVGGCLELVRAL